MPYVFCQHRSGFFPSRAVSRKNRQPRTDYNPSGAVLFLPSLSQGIKRTKRFAFLEKMPRSGREARAAIFDRGHHLMADQDSLRELGFSPVRGFPWPRSITRQLTSESKIDRVSHCPRADYDASAETCDEFRLHRNSSVCSARSNFI